MLDRLNKNNKGTREFRMLARIFLKSQTMELTLDNVKLKKKREVDGEKFTEVSDADQEFLTKEPGITWVCGHIWESLN